MGRQILIIAVALLLGVGVVIPIISCSQFSPPSTPITKPQTTEPAPAVPSNSETSPAIENKPITLRIICDDNLIDNQMKPGFGFSCLVTLPEANILFDTGTKAEILLNNMEQLQVNPEQINAVVLSHEHPDHVGGLVGFLKKKSSLPVYIPKSFSDDIKSSIRTAGAKVVEISQPEEIFSGVFTTGELGNNIKEQSLILKSSEGLILITGCSHPGILNIIRIVKSQFPNDKLYLVIGGFHFKEETKPLYTAEQLKLIINSFKDLGVINVAPCHCSGSEARELFRQTFGNGYIDVGVGKVLNLPTSKP